MTEQLKLMAVFAHPDDESLATGAALAKYAAAGVETYLVTATRGEQGWFGKPEDYPGPTALEQIREQELYAAAEVLGLREVNFLGYQGGRLDQADPAEAIGRIVQYLRRIRPQEHESTTYQPRTNREAAENHPMAVASRGQASYAGCGLARASKPSFFNLQTVSTQCLMKGQNPCILYCMHNGAFSSAPC